ncbi:hypothetical protein NQ318_009954 [Aromia moschata]|uniref:Helicase ATP-binding domain-containing protein n=1 Tax=Aromia moschata TaxID=1265417 RepID=A0AAV8YJN2_9CUCU|nr:hypothetical protein NQ318_009954 [Aromia moschata]
MKRKTKIKSDKPKITRILSKKHRKKLEKVLEKKKKKENRASLLESLQKVQATNEELSQLTSIASIQTKGLKRHFYEELNPQKIKPKRDIDILNGEAKLNSISGSKRRKLLLENDEEFSKINDPNVVGFENSDTETNDKKTEKAAQVKPAVYVDVIRNEEIQKARLKLPILAEEQQIMELINENSVVILAGETGSGKTTQVPQFLYEGGYALKKQIVVTEPRRVAAISMSKRVAEEMNLSTKEINTKLPEGGILIFVTGQQEVNSLVRKLRKTFPLKHRNKILEQSKKLKEERDDEASEDEGSRRR